MYTVSTEMKGRHEMQASKVLLLHRRMDNEPPPQRVICAAACWQFAFNCFSSHKAVPLSPGDLAVPYSPKSPATSECSRNRRRPCRDLAATDTQLNGNLLRYVHSHKGFGSLASYALIDSGVRGRKLVRNLGSRRGGHFKMCVK